VEERRSGAGIEAIREHRRAFLVSPGGGDAIRWPSGLPSLIKARAEDTRGTFALIEHSLPSKGGPPLHIHGREDEMWFVLEGELRFKADKEIYRAPAGSFVFVARGTPHCLQNIGDTPARYLEMFSPAGMETFFEEIARQPDEGVSPEVYRSIAERASMRVVGPPLSESDPL
jgi:mannose-6-phosphate isomerase-like protein (cupin superfamily)